MLYNYIYRVKEIIGNKKLELFEFPPMYSRGVFRTQQNVYEKAFFQNYFQKNTLSSMFGLVLNAPL